MPRQRQRQVIRRHAAAIVADPDQRLAALGDGDLDPGGTGIQRVLDQFLDRRGRALDHLAGRDAKTGEPSLPRMHLPQRDSFIIQRTVMNKSIAILLFGAVFILSACDPNTMTGASSGAKFQPIDSAPGGGRNAAIWENTSQYWRGTRHLAEARTHHYPSSMARRPHRR